MKKILLKQEYDEKIIKKCINEVSGTGTQNI